MKTFGLIGKNIDYSFSRGYFKDKFETNKLDCTYKNFDLENIESFEKLKENSTAFSGFNVTIPYKEEILPYLDSVDSEAKEIGAINTIKIKNNQLIGYNTGELFASRTRHFHLFHLFHLLQKGFLDLDVNPKFAYLFLKSA